jgi:UTP--glucose-1-phosphate uridylyltransferase
MTNVRRAVFPVGGLGTGILPATKAAPKELLAVVDKPLIHYAVEEVVRAGIRQLIIITSRGKRAIEDHFDKAYELESALALHNRYELLSELRRLFPADMTFQFVRQSQPLGIGHAIGCARVFLGDEPFLVVVPDELIDSPQPASAQVIDAFERFERPVVGVLPAGHATPCAELSGVTFSPGLYRINPPPGIAHQRATPLALAGRCVLTPEVFDFLDTTPPRPHGEVELADALIAFAASNPLIGCELEGERFDCGTKLGYLGAILHYGLRHPAVGEAFAGMVRAAAAERPAARPPVALHGARVRHDGARAPHDAARAVND